MEITKLLKFRNHFKELNFLAPSALLPSLQVKFEIRLNARILKKYFLSDLAKGA